MSVERKIMGYIKMLFPLPDIMIHQLFYARKFVVPGMHGLLAMAVETTPLKNSFHTSFVLFINLHKFNLLMFLRWMRDAFSRWPRLDVLVSVCMLNNCYHSQ